MYYQRDPTADEIFSRSPPPSVSLFVRLYHGFNYRAEAEGEWEKRIINNVERNDGNEKSTIATKERRERERKAIFNTLSDYEVSAVWVKRMMRTLFSFERWQRCLCFC